MPETRQQGDKEILKVRGISEQEYQLWRHHPVTELFRRYLSDQRAHLLAVAQQQWLDNAEIVDAQTLRGQILTLGDIADLPFASLYAAYQEEGTEDELQREQDSEDGGRSV